LQQSLGGIAKALTDFTRHKRNRASFAETKAVPKHAETYAKMPAISSLDWVAYKVLYKGKQK